MKNNALSITSFAVILSAIIATLAMIAFADGIRKVDWMDLESAAWACFGLAILGSVLGWCAFRRPLGRISAILGTFVVAAFLFQLQSGTESGSPQKIPAAMTMDVEASSPPESR